ncbi:hypothetical protein BU14_0284s0006 [Porphyra umbilicalis]|uniref:Uncharacterized protein n=1 Tax=Porphyra umbilicalis TaxID=2786 RepID=A0A1X6P1N6_PORUM|nr:hypothetical protein BU14_0284s0006 [Porphyra umbilicalis]|eukprot:OSX74553.1 hypothetical protein BU14_0284s0006 [Porphyra umbilicalis]
MARRRAGRRCRRPRDAGGGAGGAPRRQPRPGAARRCDGGRRRSGGRLRSAPPLYLQTPHSVGCRAVWPLSPPCDCQCLARPSLPGSSRRVPRCPPAVTARVGRTGTAAATTTASVGCSPALPYPFPTAPHLTCLPTSSRAPHACADVHHAAPARRSRPPPPPAGGGHSPPPPSATAPAVHAAVSALLASTALRTRLTGFPHIAAARAAVAALDGAPEGWVVTATAGGRGAKAYVTLAKRHAEPAEAAAAATATGAAVRALRGGGTGRQPPVRPTLDVAAPVREGSGPSPWAGYGAADVAEGAVVAAVPDRDVARSPDGTADAAGRVETAAAAAPPTAPLPLARRPGRRGDRRRWRRAAAAAAAAVTVLVVHAATVVAPPRGAISAVRRQRRHRQQRRQQRRRQGRRRRRHRPRLRWGVRRQPPASVGRRASALPPPFPLKPRWRTGRGHRRAGAAAPWRRSAPPRVVARRAATGGRQFLPVA